MFSSLARTSCCLDHDLYSKSELKMADDIGKKRQCCHDHFVFFWNTMAMGANKLIEMAYAEWGKLNLGW
jgi:hypothetical protein